jgi:hypothetical protein
MSAEVVALIGRIVERTAAWMLAGLLLCFAYGLSKLLVKQPAQSAEFKWKEFVVKLTRITPGVFFAILATSIVIVNLRSPLDISVRQQVPNPQTTPSNNPSPNPQAISSNNPTVAENIHYYLGNESPPVIDICQEINRVDMLAKLLTGHNDADAINKLHTATGKLLTYRDSLVGVLVGQDQVQQWRDKLNTYQNNPSSISAQELPFVQKLQQAYYSTEEP